MKPLRARGPMPLAMLDQEQVIQETGAQDPRPSKVPRLNDLHDRFIRWAGAQTKPWDKMLDEDRNLAVNKWVRVIVLDPMSFSVSRDYFRSKTMGFAKGELSSSIADALSVKATSTLHSRVSHILRFASWCAKHRLASFPINEAIVYLYLEETQGKAAPTAFRSFLSSIAFCKYALGLLAADEVLNSVRVRGIASKTYMDKRPLTQRDALLVFEVEHLEKGSDGCRSGGPG